jgi:hypothetical protein
MINVEIYSKHSLHGRDTVIIDSETGRQVTDIHEINISMSVYAELKAIATRIKWAPGCGPNDALQIAETNKDGSVATYQEELKIVKIDISA